MNKPSVVWNLIWGAIALMLILFFISDSSTDWNQVMPIVATLIILYISIGKRLDQIESKIESLSKN